MILLVDMGNTRLKWMRLAEEGLQRGGFIVHRDADLVQALDDAWAALPQPRRIVAASVARGEARAALDAWTRQRWEVAVEFAVAAAREGGVVNAYPRPERLGVDRWTALLAAHQRFPGASCVIDCGSALTIDAVDRHGVHLGGLIVPGLATQHRSLTGGDIHLDAAWGIEQRPQTLLANDTVQAVGYGIQYALAAFIDRVCDGVDAQLGERARRLLTGGDAAYLQPLLQGEYLLEPDLVFEGLAIRARAQQGEAVE